MNTNEPTITVNPDTPLEEIIRQLEELGLLKEPAPVEYEFRLYYNDDDGTIYATASTAQAAIDYGLTGSYLVVDRPTYENFNKFYVKNGKLVEVKHNSLQSVQLEKSNTGFTVAKNNAGLLLEPGEEHTDTEKYDYRTR